MQNNSKTLFEFITEETTPGHIAVIGSGGKTGTILKLAEEAKNAGKKVLITTTTKMWIPKEPVAQTAEQAREQLKTRSVVWTGTVNEEIGKISMLPEEEYKKLDGLADIILTEADGSKGFPLKYPAGNEPVIPEAADHLILVLGMDCLGKPVKSVCHHWERIPLPLVHMEEETVTYKTAARILTDGYVKRMPLLPYTIVLNASQRVPEEETIKGLIRLLPPERCVVWTKDGFEKW